MKKKFLMALSLVLVAAVSIGGTLAYLTTKTETITNTFTVGKIAMTLDEVKIGEDGAIVKDASGKEVRTSEGNSYKVYPGALLDKDPTVTIAAGSESCYVRMKVELTPSKALDDVFDAAGGPANMGAIFKEYDATTWKCVSITENADETIRTFIFEYKETVPYSDEATELPALFKQMQIPTNLGSDHLKNLENFTISVSAYAIQSAGFEDNSAAAWEQTPEEWGVNETPATP